MDTAQIELMTNMYHYGGVSKKELSALFGIHSVEVRDIIKNSLFSYNRRLEKLDFAAAKRVEKIHKKALRENKTHARRKEKLAIASAKRITKIHESALRKNKIRDLRFKEHKSLEQIGKMFEVSRERIRQIIEETGNERGKHRPFYNTLDDDDWLRAYAYLTNDEMAKILGCSLSAVATKRARIPYMPTGGYVRSKYIAMRATEKRIKSHGLSAVAIARSFPFDILVEDVVRVIVMSTKKPWKSNDRSITSYLRFVIRGRKNDADIFVFRSSVDDPEYFVIPADKIRGNPHMIYIGWPQLNTPKTKDPYANYIDRWDLISEAVHKIKSGV